MNLSQDSVVIGAGTGTAAAPAVADGESERADHRRERRFPMSSAMRVHLAGGRDLCNVTARGVDISESGLGMLVPVELRIGALVHVDFGGYGVSAIGRVRFCVPDSGGRGWRAGVQVIQSFPCGRLP